MSINIDNYFLPEDQVKKDYIAKIMGRKSWKEFENLIQSLNDSVKTTINDLYSKLEQSL